MTRYPLGRNLEHDPRSRSFKHPVRRAALHQNVTHTLNMPHLDQGSIGSCEGNTAVEFLGCARAVNNRKAFWQATSLNRSTRYPTETQAVRLYSKATWLDDDGIPGRYPPTDTGTSGVGIAKAMKALGGLAQYNWTFTWDAFLAALQTQPVMLGTSWYDSMFNHDASGHVIAPSSSDQPVGGHAYLAYAIDWTHSRVGCTNHWANPDGTPWGIKIGGHNGSFWIHFPLLQHLLINEQGDSLVPVLM